MGCSDFVGTTYLGGIAYGCVGGRPRRSVLEITVPEQIA